MLAEDRARGFAFEDVFAEDVAYAAGCNSGWRQALMDMESTWRAAFDREPGPTVPLSPDLIDDSREHVPAPSPAAVGAQPS
jgi:hypothetical protein